jgi:hypothetical protein
MPAWRKFCASVLAGLLAMGTASGAAPSGQIMANPEVVIIPAGASLGSTFISWSTVNCEAAQVTVTAAGGTESTFGNATSLQNAVAPWIGLKSYTFRLYGDLTRTLLLDSVVVTGIRPPTGSITANPATFDLPAADATFSTTLAWTTSGGPGGWVTRSAAGGGEQLIAQGGSNAGFEVSGLGAGETIFRLYGDEDRTQLAGSVVVTGVPPSPDPAAVWWANYPLIVNNASAAEIVALNGDVGFKSDQGDPSWGIYIQKTVANGNGPAEMHAAGLKFITSYECFGTASVFALQLGNRVNNDYFSVWRTYWSWHLRDSNGGDFRWAGAQNYFDAEDFCGSYTRLHPVFGAGGRAMAYPDGSPATGYFGDDRTDPRKSRVFDAGAAKDILGNIRVSVYSYRDEVADNPLRNEGLLTVNVNGTNRLAGHMAIAKDAACPMWIDQQRSSVLRGVGEGDIDGFWTDNFGPWDSFGWEPVKNAFGEWSVAKFRDHLAANFSGAELAAMGVTNAATFDVRTHLRDKLRSFGGTDTNLNDTRWNDARWLDEPVWRAYRIFKRQTGTRALEDYYRVTKEAAAAMGKPDFAVLGNDIPLFSLGYCRGELDMVSTEISPGFHMGSSSRGFMMPPVGRFAPAYKLGREHAKSRQMNVWMYLEGTNQVHKEKAGVANTLYYEMLANQTLPMLLKNHPDITQSAAINGAFFGFVKNARATFGARQEVADVGLYYSSSSVLMQMTPLRFASINAQPHAGAFWGWGTALGELHHQYRAIPEWKLTAQTLANLRVLVIPHADVLDPADVTNVIDPWVRAGGRLIVTGDSGLRRGEAGNFSTNSAGLSLSALTGVTNFASAPASRTNTVGGGTVLYLSNNIGLSYFQASTASARADQITNFSNAMSAVLGSQPAALQRVSSVPGSLGLNLYRDDAAQRFFIDANNYQVNVDTGEVTNSPPATFTVEVPSWLAATPSAEHIDVQVLSPGTNAPAVTVTKLEGSDANRLQVELGPVTHYTSVVLTPAPTGSLGASPSTFTLGTNAAFSTTLSWTISQGASGWVTRSATGGGEQLLTQGGTTAGFEVAGLGAGRTVFRLYADEARTRLLDSVEVTGTTSPLTVQADGTLRLDNRPFSAVGVNYYSAFERTLENAGDTSYDAGFAALGRWGVPFARFDVSGYWPSKANLFFTDRAEYFRRLDGVVASAERHGVGLVPTLFWTTFTFSDLAGERLDQLAVSNSVTRQKMREFTTEVVNRYKDSRAIWAWEFGNEWSLAVDLPNGTEFLPPTWTNLGNPPTRDPERDVLATDIILPAMREFADLVSELDPGRPLSTGHASPRPSQWHQDQWKRGLLPIGSAWTADSVEQAEEITLRHCPDPFDLLSVHIYGDDPQRIPNFAATAARAGKALFAGEFGTTPADQTNYAAMLSSIRAHSPLAAVWVFDRPRPVNDYNITTTNERSWMLRDLLPATFTSWSRGWGPNEVAAPDGMSVAAQYIFGAPRPGVAVASQAGWWSTDTFSLEAVVRTNDPAWRIFGESSATLGAGSWSTNGISWHSSTNQSDVVPSAERRVFTVPTGTNTKKFLRLRAESP